MNPPVWVEVDEEVAWRPTHLRWPLAARGAGAGVRGAGPRWRMQVEKGARGLTLRVQLRQLFPGIKQRARLVEVWPERKRNDMVLGVRFRGRPNFCALSSLFVAEWPFRR
jgi:hypothetical protein